MNPRTPEEWQSYVETLSPEDLYSKASAANQVGFVDTLREEGYSPREITGVFRIFARRLERTGSDIPGKGDGSYLDYNALLDQNRILNAVEIV